MKFSENWLREWISPNIDTKALVDLLTNSGLEVDSVEQAAKPFSKVVVGEIVKTTPHNSSSNLQVYQLNIKQNSPIEIVSADKGLMTGAKVPVAVVGAKITTVDGVKTIAAADFSGIASQGMLCSEQDLGLADSSTGIMQLPSDAEVGVNVWEYLALEDAIIDIDLTPNRGDCLSIKGLANDLHALTEAEPKQQLALPKFDEVTATHEQTFNVKVSEPKACPVYIGRLIKNINPNALSPIWMQEKLRRSGIRSIHPLVDIANFVMLEIGQPMHAFDFDKLQGAIEVRFAQVGEELSLLDGQQVKLTNDTLVIADQKVPVAIAGVMGGLDSATSETTTNVFLESALFVPEIVAGKTKQYNVSSDSAFRFERTVDPSIQSQAIERATQLILEICGGEPGPLTSCIDTDDLPQPAKIQLRLERVNKVLGVAVTQKQVTQILTRLGCNMQQENDPAQVKWQVQPPTSRSDLVLEEDLIEEVARVWGYDKIPAIMPTQQLKFLKKSGNKISVNKIKSTLVDLGFHETVTYSFVDGKQQEILFPQHKSLQLLNPISQDMGVMRVSLWPGLLQAMQYNQARQAARIKLFEIGMCFNYKADTLTQVVRCSGVMSGDREPKHFSQTPEQTDYFDLKSVVESIWRLTNHTQKLEFKAANPDTDSACHPGQAAEIWFANNYIGKLGKLHPEIAKQLDLKDVFMFELELDELTNFSMPTFRRPSKFPEIKRDISIIVDDAVPSSSLINCVLQNGADILQNVEIFDLYSGKGIASGQKSIAMGLILQHVSRTLVDQEVDDLMEKIVNGLREEFKAELRE